MASRFIQSALLALPVVALVTACGRDRDSGGLKKPATQAQTPLKDKGANPPASQDPAQPDGQNQPPHPVDKASPFRGEAMAAKPLSARDKAAFAALFKKGRGAAPIELYFTDDYSKGGLQKKHDQLSDIAKKLLARSKAKCKIEQSPEKTVKEEPSASGRTVKTVEKTRGISGKTPCPLAYQENTTMAQDLITDEIRGSISGTLVSDAIVTESIKDAELKRLSYFSEKFSKTHSAITYEDFSSDDRAGARGSARVVAESSGAATAVDGEKIKIDAKIEGRLAAGGAKYESLNILMKIKMKKGKEFVIGFFENAGQTEIFMNGEPYTAEKWKAEFGYELSSQSSESGAVLRGNNISERSLN